MHIKDFNFKDGIGMLLTAQELVDAYGRALSIGDAINNQARAKDAITPGKDSRD